MDEWMDACVHIGVCRVRLFLRLDKGKLNTYVVYSERVA